MADHDPPSDRESARTFRWSLRTLLLVVVPLCIALAYGAGEFRRVSRAVAARNLMMSKAAMSPRAPLADGVLRFRSGAVADADLAAFVPAFNGGLPDGLGTIRVLDLNGSPVSEEAIGRFRVAVPECEVRR
ncbi:hypothetical protein [Lacipirellula parvula]|uniref:Uncharacterized protein n=1 Tax=Lacipirellula parvula TaxID=2650471 RepID=A0A5K7XNQ5_9BACT|nr:hypothetical protein [Lacipirellula parvula]BBO34839.1 hypothetical protein PLANPX_4451 [Lacipirellula parvula]